DDRARAAGPVADGALRPLELVAPGAHGASHAGPAVAAGAGSQAGAPTGGPLDLVASSRDGAVTEGRDPRGRERDPAAPADADHQQAPAADLRPADGELRDRGARQGG